MGDHLGFPIVDSSVTDINLLAAISCKTFMLPSTVAKKVGRKSINAQLGRLYKSGMVERVPGPHCYLYRSRQMALV